MQIDVVKCSKEFEAGKPVLRQLNFSLASGAFTGLLGPSGCGKTTLLRIFAGLDQPSSGQILFDGKPVTDVARGLSIPPEKRNVAMVFQNYAIWPHMTVFENVAFPMRMQKKSKAEIAARVDQVLSRVQMADLAERRPDALSGGQQQRVALARALVQEPGVLLLDEPLSNLDASLRAEMRDLIRELQQEQGLTAVIVTHDWADAKVLSDTVVVLKEGRIEQVGTADDLVNAPASDFVRSLTGA